MWLYKATGLAFNLLAPPEGVKVVQGVCTANGTQPPRTAYVNQGTAAVPGATNTAQSSYCNPQLYKLYLPIGISMMKERVLWEATVGYEDLPLLGVAGNQNDYDYNDWLVDIFAEFFFDPSSGGLTKITFDFIPQARGAAYQHSFHVLFPANTFASNGTSVQTTYDQNHNVISTQTIPFTPSTALDYVVPNTDLIFPGEIVNTVEGKSNEPALPRRTVSLTLEFTSPFPFNLTDYLLTDAHGNGLFFNPYLKVINTGEQINTGDIRMLIFPEAHWPWPEERVRIDRAYGDLIFTPGTPPQIIFPDGWWNNFNNCVYNGIPCGQNRAR